jgi:hypothetical protein
MLVCWALEATVAVLDDFGEPMLGPWGRPLVQDGWLLHVAALHPKFG